MIKIFKVTDKPIPMFWESDKAKGKKLRVPVNDSVLSALFFESNGFTKEDFIDKGVNYKLFKDAGLVAEKGKKPIEDPWTTVGFAFDRLVSEGIIEEVGEVDEIVATLLKKVA